jgi:hypothetical protein
MSLTVPIPRETATNPGWAYDELGEILESARNDSDLARRAAELFEVIEDFGAAQSWWRTAASLGDADAIDYVQGILER